MRCKVCGAEYDLTLDNCPYCNSENEIKTAQMMEEELDKYDKEAEEIYRSTHKATHKAIHKGSRPTRKIIFAVVMLAGIFMLVLISSFTSFLSKDKEKEKTKQDSNVKKHIEELEVLLENKDYKGIDDYLYKKNLYGSDYRKYSEIGNTYQYYEWMCEDIEWLEGMRDEESKWSTEHKKEAIQMVLYNGLRCLHEINEYCLDRIPRKNEEYLQELFDMTLSELKESIGLEKEECEEMIDVDEISKYYVDSYVDDIYERYFK